MNVSPYEMLQILMSHWFSPDTNMSMKILNFHYNHSLQNSFRCYYVVFVFVIGN